VINPASAPLLPRFYVSHGLSQALFESAAWRRRVFRRHCKAGAHILVGKPIQPIVKHIWPLIASIFLPTPRFSQIFLVFFQLHFLTALWGQNSVISQSKQLHSDFTFPF